MFLLEMRSSLATCTLQLNTFTYKICSLNVAILAIFDLFWQFLSSIRQFMFLVKGGVLKCTWELLDKQDQQFVQREEFSETPWSQWT